VDGTVREQPDHPVSQRRIVAVGLFGSGTASLTELFVRFRAMHELWPRESVEAILRGRRGDRRFVETFVRRRESVGLTMDAAGYNWAFVDIWCALFPEIRFVWTVRSWDRWLASLIAKFARGDLQERLWSYRYFSEVAGVPVCSAADVHNRTPALRESMVALLSHWLEVGAELVDRIPKERLFTIATQALSSTSQQAALAQFAGIEPGALEVRGAHVNRTDAHPISAEEVRAILADATLAQQCDTAQAMWLGGGW